MGAFISAQEGRTNSIDMIFSPTDKYYKELPGFSALVGGMLINDLAYWDVTNTLFNALWAQI
jgi:hypothetical protein